MRETKNKPKANKGGRPKGPPTFLVHAHLPEELEGFDIQELIRFLTYRYETPSKGYTLARALVAAYKLEQGE